MLTSPRFVKADLHRIKDLTEQHNEQYIKLFGYLKPKMHFLSHAARIMEIMGPVVNLWGMPGERKNKYLKDISESTSFNINVPFTISIRHQLRECFIRLQSSMNVSNDLEIGSIEEANDWEISNYITGKTTATSLNYINLRGKKYSPKTYIVVAIEDEPVFGKIRKILSLKVKFIFLSHK